MAACESYYLSDVTRQARTFAYAFAKVLAITFTCNFKHLDEMTFDNLSKWDKRFMDLAELTATWSKDPSTKVGCVVVDLERNVLAGGYNGFPRGIDDDSRLLDREEKLRIIVHAEANTVAAAARNGHSLRGAVAYINRHPCGQCAALLIQAGIHRVVYKHDSNLESRWTKENESAYRILIEAKVQVSCIR